MLAVALDLRDCHGGAARRAQSLVDLLDDPAGATECAGLEFLHGSAGADVFVFSSGLDHVTNFSHVQGDVVDLRGTGVTSFAQLQAFMRDEGAQTAIDLFGGGTLVLDGIRPDQLQASDFLFA